jgi:hypothetical protein
MKKNDYLLIGFTVGFSLLFYKQNAGLNFLIFSLLFIILSWIRNKKLFHDKKIIGPLLALIISAISVILTNSSLSIIANCLALLYYAAIVLNAKNSIVVSLFASAISVAGSYVFVILDAITRSKTKQGQTKPGNNFKLIMTSIVIILIILFYVVYRASNPLFATNTSWINLDFISFSWICFTLFGFLICYGLLYVKQFQSINEWEGGLNNNLTKQPLKEENYAIEIKAGLALFSFLNLFLLVLNVGDICSFMLKNALPKGISHSDFVHNGVGMIILSIVMACSIILYLFRFNIQANQLSKPLIALVILWIVQSLVMITSTCLRNQIYIASYNLTYKRIGVYVWLFLAIVGLVLMIIKVRKNKTNWYLVKMNSLIWFYALIISSLVNWDKVITNYNLSCKSYFEVDYYYLFSLSNSNLPELINVTKNKNFKLLNHRLLNSNKYRHSYEYQQSYTELIHDKIFYYVLSHRNTWQSLNYVQHNNDKKINHQLLN